MPWWLTPIIEAAKLGQVQAMAGLAAIAMIAVIAGLRWMRREHCRTLILMRSMAIHMLQNRPPTDSQTRLQENLLVGNRGC
jgi:hypothetical protein